MGPEGGGLAADDVEKCEAFSALWRRVWRGEEGGRRRALRRAEEVRTERRVARCMAGLGLRGGFRLRGFVGGREDGLGGGEVLGWRGAGGVGGGGLWMALL